MARLFDDVQNEYLRIASSLGIVYPFSVSFWVFPDEAPTDANHGVFWVGLSTSGERFHIVNLIGNEGAIDIRTRDTTFAIATTTNTYNMNQWNHVFGVWAASNNRLVMLNGDLANKGVNLVDDETPLSLNRTTIGRSDDSSPRRQMSGSVAWMAVWNVALAEAEGVSLANGAHPNQIRPEERNAFWPLGGLDTEESDGGNAIDIWGGNTLTAFSDAVGPGVSDHPGGLIYPSSPRNVAGVTAAPAVGNPWYQYAQEAAVAG